MKVEGAVLQLQQGPIHVVPVQALPRACKLQILRAESAPAALSAEGAKKDRGCQALSDGLTPVVAAPFLGIKLIDLVLVALRIA